MARSHLQVITDINLLPDVLHWFEQFKRSPIPMSTWLQANMALIEGFTNAVRHSHQGLDKTTPIDINVNISPDLFIFEIWDHGNPYDFDTALAELKHLITQPDFDPLEREQQWGEVIFINLIEEYNWQIEYCRDQDSRNCLRAQCSLTEHSV